MVRPELVAALEQGSPLRPRQASQPTHALPQPLPCCLVPGRTPHVTLPTLPCS